MKIENLCGNKKTDSQKCRLAVKLVTLSLMENVLPTKTWQNLLFQQMVLNYNDKFMTEVVRVDDG